MVHVFWAAYVAVFAAEILGDKFLYTTGILATRYRTPPMMLGIGVAFMAKMGLAVVIGETIAGLSRWLVAGVTAVGVLWIAATFWRGQEEARESAQPRTNSEAAMVSCASVLFSEWADLGQLTAAAMAAQLGAPVVVWAGAVAAMMTKALLVATIGAELRVWLRRHVPEPVARYGALTLLVLFGCFSVAEALLVRR
jgi:putative Ca2+/H+ antiporter (TMEM165/GDT1 family)